MGFQVDPPADRRQSRGTAPPGQGRRGRGLPGRPARGPAPEPGGALHLVRIAAAVAFEVDPPAVLPAPTAARSQDPAPEPGGNHQGPIVGALVSVAAAVARQVDPPAVPSAPTAATSQSPAPEPGGKPSRPDRRRPGERRRGRGLGAAHEPTGARARGALHRVEVAAAVACQVDPPAVPSAPTACHLPGPGARARGATTKTRSSAPWCCSAQHLCAEREPAAVARQVDPPAVPSAPTACHLPEPGARARGQPSRPDRRRPGERRRGRGLGVGAAHERTGADCRALPGPGARAREGSIKAPSSAPW